MFSKILLAYDGSDGAKLAFEKAAEIAKLMSAEFHILAVGRIPEYAETVSEVDEAKDQAKNFYSKIMDEAIRHVNQRGLAAVSHIEFGKPGEVILRRAEESES